MKSRSIRVFISSTFRDMNAERDHLNNIIFPQIRDYCEQRFLHFIPIDLRWGIKEEDSRNGLVLSTCMEEVDNSRPFFIGILGSRYGWQPSINELGQLRGTAYKQRPWLEGKVKEGASITEMEMEYGVLRDMNLPHASFLIRSNDMAIPDDYRENIGSDAERRLEQLKSRIRHQKRYPVTEYTSIQQFGEVIKKQLLEMIDNEFPPSDSDADDAIIQRQENILEKRSRVLCDMSLEWKKFQEWVNNTSKNVLVIDGKAGVGTSTVLAYCCSLMRKKYSCKVVYYDLESTPKGEKPIDAMLHFLKMDQNRMPEKEWGMIAIDNASMLRDEEVDSILNWIQTLGIGTHVVFAVERNSPLRISLAYSFGSPSITITQYTPTQKREIIKNYILQFGKQLKEEQIELFVNQEKANISELLLLLRALVNYGSFEDLDNYIKRLTKNSFSQYAAWELQKESTASFAAVNKLLGDKYMVALTAIAAAGTGISESDLQTALDISSAEWSVLRPNVLQFCKGNEDGIQLANDSWYPNVCNPDWETVSRHLIKWFTAHPEKWHYMAPAMRHLFYFIIIPPFSMEITYVEVQADRPIVKDVLDELFAFVMSPDMVRQLNDMEYSSLWTRQPLTRKCMEDIPTMVYGRTVDELTIDEAIEFYSRLAKTAEGLSRGVDAAWCYQKIYQLQRQRHQPESVVYEAKAHLAVGEVSSTIDILKQSNLIVSSKWSLFSRKKLDAPLSYPQLCVMQLLMDAYCETGTWNEAERLLLLLYDHVEACFTPLWNDQPEDRTRLNVSLEVMAKIAYVTSGFYPRLENKRIAWKMLEKSRNYTSQFHVGHRISYLLRMATLFLCYQSAKKTGLSEDEKQQLYSIGLWAHISASICFGQKSYQYARAHLLFTYIYYKLYHKYESYGRRLHDYVVTRNGRAVDHTDEYFYGALDYGRTLESAYMNNIEWPKVDKSLKYELLREYQFYMDVEYEVQPDWYKHNVRTKLQTYRERIHL